MRSSSTLAGVGAIAALFLATGCRHVAEARKPLITEPVAFMAVTEQPGSPGVFVTTDGDSPAPAKPSVTMPTTTPPLRAESKPLRPMPARLPAMTPDKPALISPPAPTEPLNLPIPPLSSKTPPIPAAPLFAPAMGPAPVVVPPFAPTVTPDLADSTVILDEFTISVRTMPKITNGGNAPVLPKIINGSGASATASMLRSPIIPVGLGHLAAIAPETKPVAVTPVAAVAMPVIAPVAEIPPTRISHGKPTPAIKASHGPDYRWLTGELTYSHSRKCWRVRFAGVDTDEDYGGSVTLAGAERLVESGMEGKMVRVEGEILDKFAATSPRYLVAKMTILD